MIRMGIICGTTTAFPLIHWAHSQGWLAGVAIPSNKSPFWEAIHLLAAKVGFELHIIENSNISRHLAEWQKGLGANLVLVFGYHHSIRNLALEKPQFGYFNVHFGKLPDYGGGSPVFWQIRKGEKVGVLTIYKMEEGFRQGPTAIEIPFEISPDHTFGVVEANYSYIAVNGVFQLLGDILNGTLALRKQEPLTRELFIKPGDSDLMIDWSAMTSDDVIRLTKATNPWNHGAYTKINGLDVKIVEAKIGNPCVCSPGEILDITPQGMEVACVDNISLIIKIVYSEFGYLDNEHMHLLRIKKSDVFDDLVR